MTTLSEIARIEDPYERANAARDAMEEHKAEISALARIRSAAVRELLETTTRRQDIADRLGLKNLSYLYELARDPSEDG